MEEIILDNIDNIFEKGNEPDNINIDNIVSFNKNMDNKYKAEIVNLPDEFSDYQINFKVIVIGNTGVGKTCITNQAIKSKFLKDSHSTIGMEIYSLFLKIDNKIIKLQIWDTCGQEVYRSMIINFYRSTSLAIIVYSINKKSSFKELDLWIKEIRSNNYPDIKLILVGNKLDLEESREISYEEGKKFADDFGFIDFFETSAKTGENIKNMFIKAANILYDEHIKFGDLESNSSFNTFRPNSQLLRKNKKNLRSKRCC